MNIEYLNQNGRVIAVVSDTDAVLDGPQAALDLMATARYEGRAERIAVSKAAVAEDFFILSTGIAGEILQKFINYHVKLAIYGDFSGYTSKPLRDFIFESNRGKDIFFTDTREEAIRRLAEQ